MIASDEDIVRLSGQERRRDQYVIEAHTGRAIQVRQPIAKLA
jgi:hypothetical protein